MQHLFMAATWIGEQPSTSNYIHKTIGLLTDMPHATTELFYSTLENVVLITGGYFIGKRALKREHIRLDEEHNVTHHDS